jgi:hypothetical protein
VATKYRPLRGLLLKNFLNNSFQKYHHLRISQIFFRGNIALSKVTFFSTRPPKVKKTSAASEKQPYLSVQIALGRDGSPSRPRFFFFPQLALCEAQPTQSVDARQAFSAA